MPARGTVYQWLFQHTAARRRLGKSNDSRKTCGEVSTHSRPKAAGSAMASATILPRLFQHTAARRRLAGGNLTICMVGWVSTHSRPKAAGGSKKWITRLKSCFNTQPPEGGWPRKNHTWRQFKKGFNTQPPEGGWADIDNKDRLRFLFQHTAARRRLAG